ncbi:MAG TPA: YdeI/OmpD-associated family protein [Flavobacterium sp.]|nr:YdeI/OmpD-associated family protein [Flavobacterium sp.]
MKPHFFKDQNDFRKWLSKNHEKETELLVGFHKVGSRKPSMTWPESVDQALCFGWIDGVRKSVDADSYTIRFTPRKSDSIWSTVNINKMEVLTKAGLMQPAGLAAFAKRKDSKSGIYSHETEEKSLTPAYEKIFRANKKAWDFFCSQPPGYRKTAIHLVMTAKQEKTQISRLESLIADSAAGLRMKQLRR